MMGKVIVCYCIESEGTDPGRSEVSTGGVTTGRAVRAPDPCEPDRPPQHKSSRYDKAR